MTRTLIILTAILGLVAFCTPLAAQDAQSDGIEQGDDLQQFGPDAGDAVASTKNDMFVRFEREAILPVFERSVAPDAPWRAEALALLERALPILVNVPGRHSWPEVVRDAQELIESGCDDPMVLAVHALGSADADLKGSAHLLRRAADALQGSEYPAYRRSTVSRNLARSLLENGARPEATAALRSAAAYSAAAMTTPDLDARRRVHILRTIRPLLHRDIPSEGGLELLELAAADESTDPWLRNITAGIFHVRLGWDARGRGYAHRVDEEGWAGFRHHLGIARLHLEEAHGIHPDLPEAATEMIAVAMAGHAGSAKSERYWFDQAVKADFEWLQAYNAYMWSLRPRWSGSHNAMLAFGMECADTGRFETMVPWNMIKAALDISDERNDYRSVFQDQLVYEACKRVLLGMAEAQPSRRAHDLSLLAAIAWRAGQYEDAKLYMEQVGAAIDWDAAWLVRGRWNQIYHDVYAQTHANADTFRSAMAAAAEGLWDRAVELCEEALEGLARSYHSQAVAHHRQSLRLKADFEAGDWVELRFAHGLPGWILVHRHWNLFTFTTLRATPATGRVRILSATPVGNRFEIQGAISILRENKPADGAASIIFGYDAEAPRRERWRAVTFRPGLNRIDLEIAGAASRTVNIPARMTPNPRFHIQAWDDRLIIRVQNAVVFDGEWPRYAIDWRPGEIFGFGAVADSAPGDTPSLVQFSRLQIRKLTEPLPPPGPITPEPAPALPRRFQRPAPAGR